MPLKRPATLPQARRWPAAAKRRQSFCARMGGMRELLTGERAALDPASPINRALAAWDCDEPEGLRREHVSKGIRMKVTSSKVGSESRKGARKNPAANPLPPKRIKTRRIVRTDPKTGQGIGTEFVPIDFDFRSYIGGIQYDFFARTEGAQLIISERTTGAKVGAVPYTTRAAALNDREAAKQYLSTVIERVGADKFRAAVAKAPKISP